MIQPRICEVFGGTCDHRDTLLQIPLSIRWRIFTYVGVVRNMHIEALGYFDFHFADGYDVLPGNCKDTKGLLRTCTQMSAEIQGFLFNHNTIIYTSFDIRYWLEQLSWSSPITVCSMRDIYIILQKQQRPCDWPRIDQPPLDWELIESWRCAITNILSNVPSRTLRLHLICQTADAEKAKAVLAPFHDFPGVLLEFELCFNWENLDSPAKITTTAKKMIEGLVREAALIAQWRDEVEPGKGFRFLGLPLELRRLVYTYTSLATPYRKFTYRPDRAFAAEFVFCECDRSVCLDEHTHWNNDVDECGVDRWVVGMFKPFCKWSHCAYSPRCNCGCIPVALLLTCRAMYDEALDFFYSYNRLVVHPPGPMRKVAFPGPRDLTRDLQSALRIEGDPGLVQESDTARQVQTANWGEPLLLRSDTTWSFLQKIGPGTARWLRNIEVIFPRIDTASSLTDADPAYSEWLMTINYNAC